MRRIGDWTYHLVQTADGETGAWQYQDQELWLRKTMLLNNNACMCWAAKPPYEFHHHYRLHTTIPWNWRIRTTQHSWHFPWENILYGRCTHSPYLIPSMRIAEQHLAEQVLKALGG